MKKIMFTAILLTIILSCNLPASASGEDEIVATWRGGKITLKEFEDFALYYAFFEDTDLAAKSTFDERRKILNDLIKYRLVEVLADSLKLDTMKVMKESYKRKLAGVSYKHHLFPDSVRRKVFPDSEIKEFYDQLKEQGMEVGNFEREKQKIINELTKKYKNTYDSIYDNFKEFLFNKYGVRTFRSEISEFTKNFNRLLDEDIPVTEGFDRFDGTAVLASYNNDEVSTEETLNYFSRIDKNTTPSISESDVYNFIFMSYQNSLISLITEELGYTKKPEVIKIAKEGMILDHLDHFTVSFFNNSEKMKEWQSRLFIHYNAKIFHSSIEKSFFLFSEDNKK